MNELRTYDFAKFWVVEYCTVIFTARSEGTTTPPLVTGEIRMVR
jgi:hypothetical protein